MSSVGICDPVYKGLLPVGHSAAFVHVHMHRDNMVESTRVIRSQHSAAFIIVHEH
ncbi:hypothetical protein [Methanocella sp. MCL-LM]|uniref:hypothetical protein n=1 Tax=Methanocella sp. MCL-LM TaxID=3412035 RepID=UPI003C72A893